MVQGIDGRKRFSIAHPSDGTVMFTQLRPSVQPPNGDVLATPATLAARMNATDRMVEPVEQVFFFNYFAFSPP